MITIEISSDSFGQGNSDASYKETFLTFLLNSLEQQYPELKDEFKAELVDSRSTCYTSNDSACTTEQIQEIRMWLTQGAWDEFCSIDTDTLKKMGYMADNPVFAGCYLPDGSIPTLAQCQQVGTAQTAKQAIKKATGKTEHEGTLYCELVETRQEVNYDYWIVIWSE